jgi:hypothetical protein
MSRHTYNDQTITQYLLGSLPEAETERFDELSVTDDEFAETLTATDKDLLDAYVQGVLAGEELEQFKSHYLASTLRREKVKFAQAFQSFAEKETSTQAARVRTEAHDESATKRKGAGWASALSVLWAPRAALQWGTALAALALLVAGGWLAFENARLHQQVSQTRAGQEAVGRREQELQKELEGQRLAGAETELELSRVREERERLERELKQQDAQEQQRAAAVRRASERERPAPAGEVIVASLVLAPQMRGTGQIEMVSISPKTDYVAVRLELEPGDHTAYTAGLLDQSGSRTLWRSGKLRAKGAGDIKTLSVGFSARLLKPQVYVLRVTGVSPSGASEIVGDYPFRVVK